MKFHGVRRKVGVLVAEKFVGNFTRQQYANVSPFVYRFADEVHAHTCADSRYIVCAEQVYDRFKRRNNFVGIHIYFRVIRTDEIRDLFCVFEVYRVFAHTYREGFYRFIALFCGDGANERRIKSARKQKTDFCVRNETFFNSCDKFFADFFAGSFKIVVTDGFRRRDIAVTREFAAAIVVTGRKRRYFFAKSDEVFRLARKNDASALVVTVIKRTNADRVSRGYVLAASAVVNDACKLGVELCEHIDAVLEVHRQDYLAIAVALESVTLAFELFALLFKTVKLAVTNGEATVLFKRLHTFGSKSHYRKPVKTEQSFAGVNDPAVVGSAGLRPREPFFKRGSVRNFAAITEY